MAHEAVLIFAIASLLPCSILLADRVDEIQAGYQKKIEDGINKLKQAEIKDLEKAKLDAMRNNNLETAKKADDRIKALRAEVDKYNAGQFSPGALGPKFPQNEFYKMIYFNGGIAWTEKGQEIICRFQRVSKLNTLTGRVNLVVTCDGAPVADSGDVIFILDEKKGEIGRINGIGKNQTVRVPLVAAVADTIEVSVVNRGGNAVGFKRFAEKYPEFYLEVDE